jgi:hypothetical protein
MPLCGDNVLVEGVSEIIALPIRVVAPVGVRVGVCPVMVTGVDSLLPTLAGGLAIAISPGTECGAIAGEAQLGDIPQPSPLCRRNHGTRNEQIFQPVHEVCRAGHVIARDELVFECAALGVMGSSVLLRVLLPLLLLVWQIPPMSPLSPSARFDSVFTRFLIRSIFESIDEQIESAGDRDIIGVKTRDARESRVMLELRSPRGEALDFEQYHQQEGPEHTDRVIRASPSGIGGVKGSEDGPGRFQVQVKQDEGSGDPRR